MTTHALRALAVAAGLALSACGSDASDAATPTTDAPTSTASIASTASTASTAAGADEVEPVEPPTTEASNSEAVEPEPEPEDFTPVEPEDAPPAVDHPLAISVFTTDELTAAFPGETWTIDASLEPDDDFAPEEECGIQIPSLTEHITVFADQSASDRTIGQEILTTPSADWVIALRELEACDDVEATLGIDEYTVIPVTIEGAEDSVVVQVLEEASSQPHSLVLAVVTPSHTMLVSFEAVSEDLLDLDALISVVEQAIARSN